jgi:HEAT repeat protein
VVNCKRWTISAMLAAAAMAGLPKVLPALALQPVETREEVARKDVQQQEAILTDPGATPAQRDDAAKRLVSRTSKEADDVLFKILKNFANRDAQLAVARALASDLTPQPAFVDPLLELLGSGATLTDAAAQALVVYKNNDRVRDALTAFANNPTYVLEGRIGVIAAMGKLVDKKAAGALVEMMNVPDTNPRLRDAASDALAEMTGLPRGGDVQAWNQWWEQNRNKNEEEWSKDLLRGMAARRAELDKRLKKVLEETDRRLRENYRAAASDADKTKLLGDFLKNDSEDMRLLGVRLISAESAQFRPVPPAVFEQLRKMVGDSASQVRLEVAVTLGNAGERGAVDALLTQLAQERDVAVKAEIVRALGPSHDLRVDRSAAGR